MTPIAGREVEDVDLRLTVRRNGFWGDRFDPDAAARGVRCDSHFAPGMATLAVHV